MHRRTARWLGSGLIVIGVAAFGIAAWSLVGSNITATRQQRARVEELHRDWPPAQYPLPSKTLRPVNIPPLGQDFAVIRIPAIKLTAPIREGVRTDDLKHGVGHYPDSVAPGQRGNFALAGHRTTYGRPFWNIDKLRAGDLIHIDTKVGTFTYRVAGRRIIRPSDIQVVTSKDLISPKQRALTMTACHPRFSARQRYMIRAVLD
jgi:sortase A